MSDAVRFGPGSLESITLHRRVQVRITGDYIVYCGAGNSHTVHIDSPWSNHIEGIFQDEAVVREMIEDELDMWTDPCMEDDE